MSEQRRTGSWLTGAHPSGTISRYPGERLGLPQAGAGAVARYGVRLAALCIDWALSSLIAVFLLRSQWWTLAVFAVEVYVLTALAGLTVGKRLLRLRVLRLDGRPVGLLWALVRTVLLLAVIPPLITDSDARGLHDRAANTIVIRT